MTERKLAWPVNTTGHRSKLILSPADVLAVFLNKDENDDDREFVFFLFGYRRG